MPTNLYFAHKNWWVVSHQFLFVTTELPLVQIRREGMDIHLVTCHFANELSLTGVPDDVIV